MHEKYNRPYHTKKKRNIAIVSGVTLSILVSPMLAALTVGVGVPIALGYIYGVVPISLCRSGGCASVTTLRNGRGVNLEFDTDGSQSECDCIWHGAKFGYRRKHRRCGDSGSNS